MKRGFLACFVALILVFFQIDRSKGSDLLIKAPSSPLVNWSGFYAGGNFGYGWQSIHAGRLDNPNPNFPVGYSSDMHEQGPLGGGQLGFDYQVDRFVFGIVASGELSSLTGSTNSLGVVGTDLAINNWSTTWIADVGGRVGVAWEGWLPYAKGGAAWLHQKRTYDDYIIPGGAYLDTSTASKTFSGWFIGGGVELMLMRNLSAFLEYDYYNIGGTLTSTRIAGPGIGAVHQNSESTRTSVFKIGLNWREH